MLGYSHSWAYHPTSGRYRRHWPTLLADVTTILTCLAELGVTISGPDGTGDPILDATRIAFNGAESQGAAGAFILAGPHRDPQPSPCGNPAVVPGTCHTQRHPYDLAVTAVLLRCHHLLGHGCSIRSSHADWDTTWLHGLRRGQPGARQVLTTLFGPICGLSPLTWNAQP